MIIWSKKTKHLSLRPLPKAIDLWCNGSTPDFDSVCLGSNPSRSTLKRLDIQIYQAVFVLATRFSCFDEFNDSKYYNPLIYCII